MSKFYGKIGFAVSGEDQNEPGVYSANITERSYYGETIRTTKQVQTGDKINDDITINNELSIVADPFALNNFSTIQYVEYMGTKWKVKAVEVKFPRLILTTGGVYNG